MDEWSIQWFVILNTAYFYLIDTEYLFNILEALEVKPNKHITNVNKLLKAEPDE